MGTITVNVDDDTETRFRQAVRRRYGERKGTLGKAIKEAMHAWSDDEQQARVRQNALDILGTLPVRASEMKLRREDMYAPRSKTNFRS
jgi:uridine kinase